MFGVSCVGDKESGSCPIGPSSSAPPLAISSGSPNVFIEGKAAAREGDPYSGVHVQIPRPNATHSVFCGKGSSFVYFDDIPAFAISKQTTCPSLQVEGSGFVFLED